MPAGSGSAVIKLTYPCISLRRQLYAGVRLVELRRQYSREAYHAAMAYRVAAYCQRHEALEF